MKSNKNKYEIIQKNLIKIKNYTKKIGKSNKYTRKEKVNEFKEIETKCYKPIIDNYNFVIHYEKCNTTVAKLKTFSSVISSLAKLNFNIGKLSNDMKYYTDAEIYEICTENIKNVTNKVIKANHDRKLAKITLIFNRFYNVIPLSFK